MLWDFVVRLIKSAEQSEVSRPCQCGPLLQYTGDNWKKSQVHFTRFSTLLSKETADNDNGLMAHFWSERL